MPLFAAIFTAGYLLAGLAFATSSCSCSLDEFIGAFAITCDVTVIAAGLALGALFVRSLTFLMAEKELLKTRCFSGTGLTIRLAR